VLGGGSAAFAAALKAAGLGAKVALVEQGVIGGTCVNRGCIPSKNLLWAGELYRTGNYGSFPGITPAGTHLDFGQVMAQKDELVAELRQAKYLDLLEADPNISLLQGVGRFLDRNAVQVGGDTLRADKFIVATGASPAPIPLEGLDSVAYLDSTSALELKELPQSMLVIGGRAVALELAQMYAHFGTRVTILQRSPRILPEEEPELSMTLQGYFEEEGIAVHTGARPLSVRQEGLDKVVTAQLGDKLREFRAQALLLATGRRPNTADLGLEQVGIETDAHGFIPVDEEMRTTAPNIWAAGDVVGQPMLVTVAAYGGAVAAENAITGSHRRVDRSAVPHAVFTSPQLASVGLTDRQAVEKGIRCMCQVLPFSLVPKAAAIRDTRGLIKMVADADAGRVLGVHILAPGAADLIHEAVLAVKFGLTVQDLVDTIHVYPTMSEAIKLVAQSFSKDVAKLSCCAE
jgi:mercuric reductase